MIKVFLVDDHQMVIEGIVLLLQNDTEIECVGYAKDGYSAISQLSTLDVDVVLLDINLPDKNGTEVCRILSQQQAHLKIIALSMLKEASLVKMMLKEGAKGYLLKNAGQAELIKAIKTVHQGERYLSSEVNTILLDSLAGKGNTKRKNPFPKLSRREKEVLQLIIDEKTTQEIAGELFISIGTVETHRRNMMSKLGVRNTAGLVRVSFEYDLLEG